MMHRRIHRLYMMNENNQVVGVVSMTDIISYVLKYALKQN